MNPVDIAHPEEEPIRTGNVLVLPTNRSEPDELPVGDCGTPPESQRESVTNPVIPPWSTLHADPRFLEDIRRAVVAVPKWNARTRASNARSLAIAILGLAGIGPVVELIRHGGIGLSGSSMIGSVAMVFVAVLFWQFGKRDPQPQDDVRRIHSFADPLQSE